MCCRLHCEMGLENHDFSRRKKQSHGRRGNLNSTLRISCQDVALLKGFGIKNKLTPQIRSVCFWLKYCIVGVKCKNNLSGRKWSPGLWKICRLFTQKATDNWGEKIALCAFSFINYRLKSPPFSETDQFCILGRIVVSSDNICQVKYDNVEGTECPGLQNTW